MIDITDFLDELAQIDWFKNCGVPNEKYHMIFSLFEAYDTWGQQTLSIWEPHAYELEDEAAEKIGDDEIDEIFAAVSSAIGDVVWNRLGDFLTRRNLWEEAGVLPEILDMVKQDISWACIERILKVDSVYTKILNIYKEGYFPCSWIGEYPSGQAVVM